jgi:hypothetical protein
MAEDVTTSATTSEATVAVQPNVAYRAAKPYPGGSRYTVIPHPPTPRD